MRSTGSTCMETRKPLPLWPRFCAAALLVLLVATPACRGPEPVAGEARVDQPVEVSVAEVRRVTVADKVETTGTLVANQSVEIFPEVDGIARVIEVDLGDLVQKGQPLVRLNDDKYRLRLESAQASLERIYASMGLNARGENLVSAEVPFVRQAQAQLDEARIQHGRVKALVEKGVLPTGNLVTATRNLKVAEAALQGALDNVRNWQGAAGEARAAISLARKNLQDTVVRAPFTGFVQQKLVSLGELVNSSRKLFVLVDVDPLKLNAALPEKYAPRLKAGLPVDVRVDAFADRVFRGRVSRVSPSVDPAARTLQFEAILPNAGWKLKPGTFSRVDVLFGEKDALTVPQKAVYSIAGNRKVFVVSGGTVRSRTVATGNAIEDQIVVEGLTAGERVATSQLSQLGEGQAVKGVLR